MVNIVKLEFLKPGSPYQNGFLERLNRSYREEVLDLYLFGSLQEVREITLISYLETAKNSTKELY
jgi:putative transposase